jgi:polyferredoxin
MKKVSKTQLLGLIFLLVYVVGGFLFGNLYMELKNGDIGAIFIVACLVAVLIAIIYNQIIKRVKSN